MVVVDDFAEGAFSGRKTKDVVAALGRWGANVMTPKGKETCLLITDDVSPRPTHPPFLSQRHIFGSELEKGPSRKGPLWKRDLMEKSLVGMDI